MATVKKKTKKKPKKAVRKYRFLKFCAGLLIVFLTYLFLLKWVMPPITITQISEYIDQKALQRDYVSWDEISPNVKLAVLASEDQLFPSHQGVDWDAMKNSLEGSRLKNQKARGAAASTITQQTAKNVFLWQGKGWTKYVRKIPELMTTKLIEWIWGKKRILHVYLNVIEMGEGVFGIEAAANKYFNKSAKELTRTEAAMIAASLPNPKKFTVRPLSERVKWRYPKILKQMDNLEGYPEIKELIKN